MGAEEIWELADDIHNISSDLSFVTLAWSILAKIQQLFNHHYNKLVFVVGAHTAADRT